MNNCETKDNAALPAGIDRESFEIIAMATSLLMQGGFQFGDGEGEETDTSPAVEGDGRTS